MKFKGTEDDLERKLRWYTHMCEDCGSMCLSAVKIAGKQPPPKKKLRR